MGALFSSEPPRNPTPRREYLSPSLNVERVAPRPSPSVANNYYRQQEVTASISRYSGGTAPYNHQILGASNSERISTARRSPPVVDLLDGLTNKFYTLTMNQCMRECAWSSFSSEIDIIQLVEHTPEYDRVKQRFARNLRQENPSIIKIEKVRNYVLMGQYLLKKQEYRRKNINVTEKYYYHGTKQNNMMNICRENFSWRITNRNKFGKGVSFAPTSSYAIHYCDKKPNRPKIMFVAKVLVGRTCVGYENMELPRMGCDTSTKDDGKVIVKFYDNEFYPEYLIHFTANIIRYNNNNRY